MDATRPNEAGNGASGHRFYVICEADYSFRAISAGHGGGRDLKGTADFANGRRCAKNFGNALEFETDGWRRVCDTRDENVFQRLLPRVTKQNAVLIRLGVKRYAKSDARRHGDGSGRKRTDIAAYSDSGAWNGAARRAQQSHADCGGARDRCDFVCGSEQNPMAAGSTNGSPADCSTEADAFGGGGTAANWMRQPTQHDLPRSPRSLPGVGLPLPPLADNDV